MERTEADLRGASGGNCPLHDDNSAWRPLFAEKRSPSRDSQALFFQLVHQNVGQTYKSRRYLVENRCILSIKRPKLVTRLQRDYLCG